MIEFSANFLEWVFFVSSIVHVLFTIFTWRSAIIDSAFLLATGVNGARMAVADQNVREEGIKIVIGVVMVVAAVAAVLLDPPPPPYQEVPQSMVSMVAFVAIACMLILSSATSRSVRKRLERSALDVQQTIGRIEGGQSDSEVVATAKRMRQDARLRNGDNQS